MIDQHLSNVTALLKEVNEGRDSAFNEVIEKVYADLQRIASNRMQKAFNRNQYDLAALTQSPSEIVNEAVIHLMEQHVEWQNTEQFFAIATRIILRVIVDYQRHRMSQKRGGGNRGAGWSVIDQHPSLLPSACESIPDEEFELLHDALSKLNDRHPRKGEIMTLHMILGFPQEKVAELVCVSLPTVERDLKFAKAWLKSNL